MIKNLKQSQQLHFFEKKIKKRVQTRLKVVPLPKYKYQAVAQ